MSLWWRLRVSRGYDGRQSVARARGQILTGNCFLCVKLTALEEADLVRGQTICLRTPKTSVLVLVLLI